MSKVEIKPIEKDRWHGKKGKDAFGSPITIEAPISTKTGKFKTGLEEEDRVRLEKETGLNLSDKFIPGDKESFWTSQAGKIKLYNKTNIFDSDKATDEIKISVMKASDLVANSMEDYENGKCPNALFVISDEVAELEIKASKISLRNNLIIETAKFSKSKKAEIIQIVTGTSVKRMSDNFVVAKFEEMINNEGPDKIMTIIKRDATRNSAHCIILEGLHQSILRKDGTSVYYMDDQIGFDTESAIDYVLDKKNQTLKAQILERIV